MTLYIGASLDGYIARQNDDIEWLTQFDQADQDYGYAEFMVSIDTVIMGRTTYDQVLTFAEWPYSKEKCYVMTSRPDADDDRVEFRSGDPAELIAEIRAKQGGGIWLIGGSQLVHQFLSKDLVDRYIISIVPILLGSGKPLFRPGRPQVRLKLVKSESFSTQLVQLTYERR